MKDCEKLKIISDIIEKSLKDFSENRCEFDELILITSFISEYETQKQVIPIPCMECANCYDFNYYRNLLIEFITNENMNINILKENLQYWEKTKANDLIIDNISNPINEFHNTLAFISNKKTVYLDSNIFDLIEKNDLINHLKLIKDLIFTYSPIHLEEVYRMRDENFIKTRIETISKVTNNHVVLNMDKVLNIFLENPKHSYGRVLGNLEISIAFEKYRVVKKKDKDVFFKDFFDENFYKSVNNSKNIFSEISKENLFKLLVFSGYSLNVEDFKKENKTYGDILHMIYSLYDVFDNISFWREEEKKDDKTFKSSVYDIEHLIYSTFCDFFITADKKLAKRAKQMFDFMNIKTKVIMMQKKDFNLNNLIDGLINN